MADVGGNDNAGVLTDNHFLEWFVRNEDGPFSCTISSDDRDDLHGLEVVRACNHWTA